MRMIPFWTDASIIFADLVDCPRAQVRRVSVVETRRSDRVSTAAGPQNNRRRDPTLATKNAGLLQAQHCRSARPSQVALAFREITLPAGGTRPALPVGGPEPP